MRPRQKESDHEAGRQKFRLNPRGSDLYPHLGRFIVTNETRIIGNFCYVDLGQVIPVRIKEETSDLRLVLEAEVLAHYRPGLRRDLSARLKQSEVSVVSKVESEVQEEIEDDQPNFGGEGEQPSGHCSVSIPHQIGIAEL